MQGDKVLMAGMVAVAVVALVVLWQLLSSHAPEGSGAQQFATVTTGSTANDDVAIALTPRENGGKLRIEIAANTHSVELSQFNMQGITTLEFDGKKLKPEAAPRLSGHHASGMLVFDTGRPVQRFTVTIQGIPAVAERTFVWG
jgi:hypothetical protein